MVGGLDHAALEERRHAAARYQPANVEPLLIAEAPPAATDRYFYFENIRDQDSLFRHVYRGITKKLPSRERKVEQLNELRELGVFLIDLREDPVDGTPLVTFVPELVVRCVALKATKIVLIKATVFDVAHVALKEVGLPVCNVRIPFPGSGRQREFDAAFTNALETQV